MSLVEEMLKDYHDKSPFSVDGGVTADFAFVYAGPYFIKIRNTQLRKSVICYHDLHHIFSGYNNSRIGEGEAGAWELATDCWVKPHTVFLNLAGMATGLMYSPSRIFKAFHAGSGCQNLYKLDLTNILPSEVSETEKYIHNGIGFRKNVFVVYTRFGLYAFAAYIILVLLLANGFAFGKRTRA